jgi:hypothetical protein
MRLLIEQKVNAHNADHPDRRTLLIAYDDLNPVLDEIIERGQKRDKRASIDSLLEHFRLEDHQDAILMRAVTQVCSALLSEPGDESHTLPLPPDMPKRIKNMPRAARVDMAVLAALYDQPGTTNVVRRFARLRRVLRLGWRPPVSWPRVLGMVFTVASAGLGIAHSMMSTPPLQLTMTTAACIALAVMTWGLFIAGQWSLWRLVRRVHRDMPAVPRNRTDLRAMLAMLDPSDRAIEPWPKRNKAENDSRYHMTRRLLGVLEHLGYRCGMMVLVDRVDEPTYISGHADRMRKVVWPMLANKFLQQENVGLKLLLPIELRYLVRRESSEFYQEARLDKQNMIDRLAWSGATLYDLCAARLKACRAVDPAGIRTNDPVYLTDLFDADVSREMIIDALDQMHQPRDAFKMLYAVIQEHCRTVPADEPRYQIPRLTLDMVRRQQSQRVQEFYRGLAPS